jgi:hypothetical protein
MERFNLEKLNEVEGKEKYRVEVPTPFFKDIVFRKYIQILSCTSNISICTRKV